MAAELLIGAHGGVSNGGEKDEGDEGFESVYSNPTTADNGAVQPTVQQQAGGNSEPTTSRRLQRELQPGFGGGGGNHLWARGVGVTLDEGTWPIVHGSRQSYDNTAFKSPLGTTSGGSYYRLYNSQEGIDDDSAGGPVLGNFMVNLMALGDDRRALGEEGGAWTEFMSLINFNVGDANAVSVITQRISDTQQLLWTSTIQNVIVFRQTQGRAYLERLATFDHGRNERFHGSYAFCASNGTATGFFTTMDDSVTRYVLTGSDASGWIISRTGELALPGRIFGMRGGHLVGLTALADGTVVACSKDGDLMAVRLDDNGQFINRDVLRLSDHGVGQGHGIHVSNSISSEGQQVFVVTEQEIVRVDFDADQHKFRFIWKTTYGGSEGWWVGRLGPGSGSTPTVTSCGGQSLVVITDGALPMNLLYYSVDSGALVGSRRVQFGADENGSDATTSEQSVAVDGCRAFVVQNYMGGDRLEDYIHCASAPSERFIRRRLADFCLSRTKPENPTDKFGEKSCPAAFGCSAFGAALYELTPQQGGGLQPIRRVWTRDDVSCGTSIPLISTNPASQVVYCAGIKSGSSQWSLLGMDLWTGADCTDLVFYDDNLARNFLANPFYAGVESGGDDSIIIGSIGGVLHIAPEHSAGARRSLFGSNTTSLSSRIGGLRVRGLAAAIVEPLILPQDAQQRAMNRVTGEIVAAMAALGVLVALVVLRVAKGAASRLD